MNKFYYRFIYIPNFQFVTVNQRVIPEVLTNYAADFISNLTKSIKNDWSDQYNRIYGYTVNHEIDLTATNVMFSTSANAMHAVLWYIQRKRSLQNAELLSNLYVYYTRLLGSPKIRIYFGRHFETILPLSQNNPQKRCIKKICPDGFGQEFNVVQDTESIGTVEWKCIPCPKNHFKPMYGNQSCLACPGITIADIGSASCFDPYETMYLIYNTTPGYIIITMSIIGIIFNIVTVVTFIRYRRTPVVRSSNISLSLCQLLAHMLLFSITPLLSLGKPSVLKCQTTLISTGLLLTIICSITLIKTQKLLFIFKADLRIRDKEKIIATATDTFLVLILVLIQLCIAFVSLVQSPSKIVSQSNNEELTHTVSCSTNKIQHIQFIYILSISLLCAIQGFRARKLPAYFNETTFITFAMLTTTLMLVLILPFYHSSTFGVMQTAVNNVGTLCCNLTLIVVMYGFKLYVIFMKPEENTQERFRYYLAKRCNDIVTKRIRDRNSVHSQQQV